MATICTGKEDTPNQYVRESMAPELFERVLPLPVLSDRIVTVEGIPLYMLGNVDGKIDEFQSERVIRSRKKRA